MQQNKLFYKAVQIGSALLLMSGTALATSVPVDLSSWVVNGTGTWNLEGSNDSVRQTVNGNPTVFHNNQNSQGTALSGTIRVDNEWDNDYIGFMLGYNNNDLGNPSADYLLIDWKQWDQSFDWGEGSKLAKEGLSISRVTGATSNDDMWSHTGTVSELQRATNLGSTGWIDHQSYLFDLVFTSTYVEVFVDGTLELSINGSFNDGSFGFYNYSQENVLYAGITEGQAPPQVGAVPLPAAAFMFAPALLGLIGLRRKAKQYSRLIQD